jgi:hypothetical protein
MGLVILISGDSVKGIKHKGHRRLYRMRKKRMAVLVARLKEFLRAYGILKRVRMHIDQDMSEAVDGAGRGLAFSTVCRLMENLDQESEGDITELEALERARDREIDLVLGPAPENHTKSKKGRSPNG